MAPKRSIEWNSEHSLSIDDHEPPSKRRMTSLIPHTPLPKHKHTHQPRTPFTSTSTPFPARPSDSPSNPFGRKRIQILSHSLPPPTSFSKHLPLRFQLVRPGVSPRLGGVYRVVQVPLSYTFAQLRCLITWLFGGGYAPDNGCEDRHLFELKKKIVMYSPMYKPCQIRSGFTAVKLSTARDPCRYRPEEDDEDALYDESATLPSDADAEHSEDGDEDADEGWTWEAEEEYTLGNVWSRGGDLQRGIIYHHTPDTAVHITVNVGPLPRRKGVSNTPYVFQGRGRVRLLPPSPLPLPRPVFSVPTHKLPVPSSPARSSPTQDDEYEEEDEEEEYGDASSSGLFFLNSNDDSEDHIEEMPSDEHDSQEEEEDEQTQPDDPTAPIDPAKYNAPNAFAAYLRFAHQHRRRCEFSFSSSCSSSASSSASEDDDEADCDVPGLVYGGGSSSSPMKPSSSSPIKSSSPSSPTKPIKYFPSSPVFGGTYYNPQTSLSHSLSSFAAYTPAPAHASWQRLRLERVRKRMERAKRVSGLRVGFEEGEGEGEEEVDELALDVFEGVGTGVGKGNGGNGKWGGGNGGGGGVGKGNGGGGGGGGGKRGNGKWKMGKDGEGEVWVKPGVVWDPFADELEV